MSKPLSSFCSRIDDLLHARKNVINTRDDRFVLFGVLAILLFGGLFGAAMGTYGDVRPLQMLYSGIKVPLLLLLSFALTFPSFYVFNALLGMRKDFASSLRAVMATQVGMTIFLASLAPFTLFWYVSCSSYPAAKIFNIAIFAVAACYGWTLLRRFYRDLIARNRLHGFLVQVWIIQFAFVAIQLTWVLRPFIGNPGSQTQFLREDAWGNAYVAITQMFIRFFSG